ncbi:MAG: hypothetical protein BGO73_01590 [Burkholderiales bacterium 66-26]|nr:MAG: hypothetical protein BGO73_01590 [Burkholderiales bacterium 66-26]
MSYPQHGTDASNRPAQAAIDADGPQAIREGFGAGPAPQGLRAAVQVVRGLLSRHAGAGFQFQRGELLGLRYSAVIRCLHRNLLSTQQHGLGMGELRQLNRPGF